MGRTCFAFDQREGHTWADQLEVEDIRLEDLGEKLLEAWHRDGKSGGLRRLEDSLEVQRMEALSLGNCSVDMLDLNLIEKKVSIRECCCAN